MYAEEKKMSLTFIEQEYLFKEWLSIWMDRWMDKGVGGWMDDDWKNGWMNGQVGGWLDDEWMMDNG